MALVSWARSTSHCCSSRPLFTAVAQEVTLAEVMTSVSPADASWSAGPSPGKPRVESKGLPLVPARLSAVDSAKPVPPRTARMRRAAARPLPVPLAGRAGWLCTNGWVGETPLSRPPACTPASPLSSRGDLVLSLPRVGCTSGASSHPRMHTSRVTAFLLTWPTRSPFLRPGSSPSRALASDPLGGATQRGSAGSRGPGCPPSMWSTPGAAARGSWQPPAALPAPDGTGSSGQIPRLHLQRSRNMGPNQLLASCRTP